MEPTVILGNPAERILGARDADGFT